MFKDFHACYNINGFVFEGKQLNQQDVNDLAAIMAKQQELILIFIYS